jgi:hypothetical protein
LLVEAFEMVRSEAGAHGRTDVVAIRPNPLRIDVFKNLGSAFDGAREWRSEPYDYQAYLFRFGDTRARGRADVIAIRKNPLRVVTWRNDGSAFDAGSEWLSESYDYSGYLFFAADIDGDGKTDLIAVQQKPLRIVTWRNSGTGFERGCEWLAEPYDYSEYLFFAGDIDGDGKTDIIAVQQDPLRIVTWRNAGSGFDNGCEWLTEPYDYSGYLFFAGDTDGDGKTDLLAMQPNPLRIVNWQNKGWAFGGGQEKLSEAGDYSGCLLSLCDTGGSSKMDVIAIRRNPPQIVIWQNNGSSFEGSREWFPPDGGSQVDSQSSGLLGLLSPDPITILLMRAVNATVR